MSEMAAEGPGGGRGFGGTVRKYWWVGAVALAGGLAFFWLRSRSGSAASGSSASTGTSGSAASDSGIDYGGELSVIQTELESVLAGQSSGAAGGGGGSGTITSGTGAPGQGPGSTVSGGSTGSTGTGSGSTGTPPPGGTMGTVPPVTTIPPGSTKPSPPPAPAGVRVTKVTSTQVGLAWTPVAGATDYRCRVTYQGKLITSKTARTPAITIDGLTPNHTYTFHVAASNAGGTGPETNGPAQKTHLV